MKFLIIFFHLVALVVSQLNFDDWHAPVAGDVRSPCPALNSLANHGFLPRNGKNLTVPVLVDVLPKVLNLSVELATGLALAGMKTASPGSNSFDLDDLDKHNIIEHDASLSRKDTNAPGGEKQKFCTEIFDEFLEYFNESTQITVPLAAAARWGRIQTERKRDPKFSYSAQNRFNSYAESAVYSLLLNDPETSTVPIDWLKVFFSQERLPHKEGWRPVNSLDPFSLAGTILAIAISTPEDLSNLVSPTNEVLHAGMF